MLPPFSGMLPPLDAACRRRYPPGLGLRLAPASGVTISIREVGRDELEPLVPILLLAEPSESALRWGLEHLSDAYYRLDVDGQLAGAASMRWRDDPCELEELAVDATRQGAGLGRRLVGWLLDEARRRGKHAMVVGTGNASVGNIIFYQKCGFRLDHVRRDYFWYYATPRVENGLPVRDMLVLRHDLDVPAGEKPGPPSRRDRRGWRRSRGRG
jgi:GNAT superfamily N-acetyltransferase